MRRLIAFLVLSLCATVAYSEADPALDRKPTMKCNGSNLVDVTSETARIRRGFDLITGPMNCTQWLHLPALLRLLFGARVAAVVVQAQAARATADRTTAVVAAVALARR